MVKRYNNMNPNAEYDADMNPGSIYPHPAGPSLPHLGPVTSGNQKDGKTSIHYLLCQEFIRMGGHQAIVERIADKENPLPITQMMELLHVMVVVIIYIREHTDYDSELQDFKQIVLAALEDYMESDSLLPSIKEFKPEYFKTINQSIVKFRLGNSFNKRMSTLVIECAKRCLNSAYLSVRVQGCKEIESRCSTAHRSNTSHLSKEELAAWLSKNQVISSIFGANHHSGLIERSEYILKILSRSDIGIKEEEIKLIWNLTKRDKQTKKEIYAILGKVGDLLNTEVQEFIFEKFKEYDQLLIDDINFLYSFKKNTDFQLECTWKILNNNTSYDQEVVQSAFEKLEDMMKFSSMEKKLDYIKKSIEKMVSNDLSLVIIRILKATLKSINLATARVQNMGEQFEKVKGEILVSFYENFNIYCEKVEEICKKDTRKLYNAPYECFVDSFNHEEHLKEKLAFIAELYKLYKIPISKEHLNLLWKCLSTTNVKLNVEMFFKWLNSQVEAFNSDKFSFLTGDLIEYFYSEKILDDNNNYSMMETEGFALFKSLFKIVNEKYHRIQILNSTRGKTKHQTITSNGATITSTTYANVSQKKEFIIYDHPDKLLGIEIIWRIMIECNNIGVTADCMVFIGNLYSNISDMIEDQRMSIEEDLVRISFEQINKIKEKINKPIPESFGEAQITHWNLQKEFLQKQIERNFMHIKSFMNNSELCGLDEFMTFDPGYKISFTVINKISWGKGCHTKKGVPTKFRFTVSQNITLWNLKNYIITKLEADKTLFKIEKLGIRSKEFKDSENSRTLLQLGIEDDDKLSVTAKMSFNALDHLSLMFSDGTLTPETSKMFGEVFSLYKNTDGVMDREGAANFLRLCTNQNTKMDDPRVNRLFDSYSSTKNEKLTCDEFKQFYIDSINSKEQTVWSNIRSWNYKTDLKHGTERSERDRLTLLRYKIPQNIEYFNYALDLLENEDYEIAKSAWRFISDLCVNPEIIEKILTLDLFDEKDNNWIKSENAFKLIYILRIIHFFLHYELNTDATVRVMYKDEEYDADKNLQVVGNSILKNVLSGVPPPIPAVPVNTPPEQNTTAGEGTVTNITSASTNAPPPPPPPGFGPAIPLLESQEDKDAKKVQFDEEEEYNVKIYPPGGKAVEDYQMEVEEETIKTETNKDVKVEGSNGKTSEVKEENYTEDMSLPVMEIANKYKDQMVNWVSKFIEKGGYDYICDLYLSDESAIATKLCNIELMNEEEKSCSRLLLDIIGVFNIVAAYVNDATIPKDEQSQKALEDIREEPNYDNINEDGDEDETMEIEEPSRGRTLSSVNKEKDEIALINAKISLYREINSKNFCESITPDLAKRIIEKFDFVKFIQRTLTSLNTMLSTRNLSQLDKDIINQNMRFTMNLFLYDERSLSTLYNFKDEETKTDLNDFIIKGMTFSSDQEIKTIFMNTIWFICGKILHTERERLPLMVILDIIKDHFFSSIKDSSRYYGYKEFYSGFCNLLREYFKVRKSGNRKFENIIEPRIFLKQLTQILKEYTTKEKRNTVLEDHNLMGMFDIMSCIFSEMPEYIETFALDHGLLEELWVNCLFQDTLEAPNIDLTSQFDQNSVDLHANKCKTKESRNKAFTLLTLLTTNSAKVREKVYTDCLSKMVS